MPFPPPARCLRQSFYAPIKSEHHRVLTDFDYTGFAAFEEDAEADMVEWLYMYDIHNDHFKAITCREEKSFSVWQMDRIKQLQERLQYWIPEFLAKYPEPTLAPSPR